MGEMDPREAERLVETYSDLILRLSYTYLKSAQDGEDICQTVLLKLLTGNETFDSPEHERAWVIRTAINCCKDELRAFRRRSVPLEEAEEAAALCGLLVGTAFAASPGLRSLLAEALGGFAPYVWEQESEVYTWNGFELKLLSAMADENMIRVFVQVRDTEERGRLDIAGDTWGEESPWLSIGSLESGPRIKANSIGHTFQHYDAETQTAVAVVTAWGEITEDLAGGVLRGDTPLNMMDAPQNAAIQIPFDVRVITSKTLLKDIELDGIVLEEVRLSPLSVTIELEKEAAKRFRGLLDGDHYKIRVKMADGTMIATETEWNSGHKSLGEPEADSARTVLIWNLADPAEMDQIQGVYFGEQYFPVK